MDYNKLFNTKFVELLDDLIAVFPNDTEFKLFRGTIQLTMVAQPDMVKNMFKQHLTANDQFTQSIQKRDEKFFLDHKYDQFQTMDNSNYVIDKLKHCWGALNPDNKEQVWKYLTVLLLLAARA